MAIKFKITGSRIAEACSVAEYLLLSGGNTEIVARLAPRFVIDEAGEYIVKVVTDEDGDISSFEGVDVAFMQMSKVTPKRLDALSKEFVEAVKNIINPQNAGA